MKIIYTLTNNFDYICSVVDSLENELIRFNMEIFQDIKYRDWSGMCGKPDVPFTNEETWNELDALALIAGYNMEAWKFLKNELIDKLN